MTSHIHNQAYTQAYSSEEDRLQLLERITRELDPSASENLKEDYNHLVNRQSEGEPGLLPDPIEFLPPEIWIKVLKAVGTCDDDNSNPADSLLLATLVSPTWRDAILNTPEVWTDVTINLSRSSWDDDVTKLLTVLQLSDQRLLHLRIRPSSGLFWSKINTIVSPHRSRIQQISLDHLRAGHDSNETSVGKLVSLGELPQLDDLQVASTLTREDPNPIFDNATSLTSTNLVLPVEILQKGIVKSFHKISVADPPVVVIPQLDRFNNLRSLSWWRGGPPGAESLPENISFSLRELQELTFYRTSLMPIIGILHATPKLTSLCVNIQDHWDLLAALIDVCSTLPALVSLQMSLLDPWKKFILRGPAKPLPIRNLIVTYERQTLVIYSRLRSRIPDLMDMLERCTPKVEEFHFHAPLHNYLPVAFISSGRNLVCLTLHLHYLESISQGMVIHFQSLISLKVAISPAPNFGIIPWVKMP